MKILSFDVGIIHLAYCLLEIDDNKNFKILKWGLINLILDVLPNCHSCLSLGSNNEQKFSCQFDKLYCFCNKHKKNYDDLQKKFSKTYIKNPTKDICIECSKKSSYHLNEEHYCSEHYKKIINKFEKESALKEILTNCSKISIDTLKFNMINILDSIPELLVVDSVVIENQPSLKNPKMKGIADNLYTYFLIRGIIDKKRISIVSFFSPSNKLKTNIDEHLNKSNTDSILENTTNSTEKYKMTKALGIQYCLKLLEGQNQWITYLNSHKKKDDLADSFLQGINYILTKI
jgi:hypothetical protein